MTTQLDLLLVNAPSRIDVYGALTPLAAIEVPVWAGLIARYCLNKGFSVQILDAEAEGLTTEQTAQRIVDAAPRLAVFCIYGQQPSASTQCMPGAVATLKWLQLYHQDIRTLALGTHPSALPEQTVKEGFNFVCQGEGPVQIVGLFKGMKESMFSCSPGESWQMPGIWHGRQRPFATTPNISDLDRELPSQAWELLDMTKYRAHNWHLWSGDPKGGYASIQTSLGCPYSCSFCMIWSPFGDRKMRFWSADNVVEQITTLVRDYNISNIKIPDEMFCLNKQ